VRRKIIPEQKIHKEVVIQTLQKKKKRYSTGKRKKGRCTGDKKVERKNRTKKSNEMLVLHCATVVTEFLF